MTRSGSPREITHVQFELPMFIKNWKSLVVVKRVSLENTMRMECAFIVCDFMRFHNLATKSCFTYIRLKAIVVSKPLWFPFIFQFKITLDPSSHDV